MHVLCTKLIACMLSTFEIKHDAIYCTCTVLYCTEQEVDSMHATVSTF
jgi:hypothetical protein